MINYNITPLAFTKNIIPRHTERLEQPLYTPLGERHSLPPHRKSAVFLNPAKHHKLHTYGRKQGGGIGANV